MIRKIVLILFPFFYYPFLVELPNWVLAASACLWLFAVLQYKQKRFPVRSWHVNLATLLLCFLVYKEFKSILGPEAGSSSILILLGLKFHDLKKPGDFMTVLFTYLVLTMNMLLFSQTLFTTFYVLFLIVALVYSFMSLDAPEKSFKELRKHSPKILSADTLFALPLFIAMFFLFPRFNMSFGNLLTAPKKTVGFSGDLNPGEMSSLATSEEIAFRVVFQGKRVSSKEMYWRGQVLAETDGFGWKRPYFRGPTTPHVSSYKDSVTYNVILEPKYEKTLFVLENTLDLTWTDASRNRILYFPEGSYETQFPMIQRSYYQGISSLSRRLDPVDSEKDYLALPETDKFSPEFKKLVSQLKSKNAETTIRKTLEYFKNNNYSYSLSTPKMASVDEFLFKYKNGFCEHYASSFAVLMRAAGIPARVVIGFQGGDYNAYGDYFIVKEKFAHAWTEVFQGDQWTLVDPTTVINQGIFQTAQRDLASELDSDYSLEQVWAEVSLFADSVNNAYMLFL